MLVDGSATASVSTSVFTADTGAGVLARGSASVQLDGVAIEAIVADASGVGVGLELQDSAQAAATRTVIEGAQGRGALVSGASAELTLSDAVVRSTAASSTMALGRGVEVSGGRLTVRRALFDSNLEAGIYARSGSTVDLSDLIARRTARVMPKGQGGGVEMFDGTRATLSRVNADQNESGGVLIVGKAATATITDLVVRGIATPGFGALGVTTGGHATVSRAAFAADRWASVSCSDAGSWLALSDATILDAAAAPELEDAAGMTIGNGCHLTFRRAHIERTRRFGINLYNSIASIADLVVRDTRSVRPGSNDGTGLQLTSGSLILERVLIESSRRFGIECYGAGTNLEASDLTIHQTTGSTTGAPHCYGDVDDSMGSGIAMEFGSSLVATRVLVDGSHGANLVLCKDTGDPGTGVPTASISDAIFSSAAALPCTGRPDCPDATHAYGIEVFDGANLSLQRFVVEKNVRAGLSPLSAIANVTLRDGVISDEPLGLSYAGESRPINQLAERVLFERDQQNVLLPPPPSISPP
jgi:hypothetical protein